MQIEDSTNEVRRLLDEYAAAVLDKDVARFMRLYHEDLRVFDMWDSWSYEGRSRWREAVTAWFASLAGDRVDVEFDSVDIDIFGACAVADAFVTYSHLASDGSRDRAQTNRLTWVLVETAGRWSIRHEHTSAPVDPESGRAKTLRRE
jgi:uncharacterized protein (TIGR02246 family)